MTDAAPAPENQIAIESLPLSQRILVRYLRQKYAGFPSIERMSDAELIERYRNHTAGVPSEAV